MVTSIWNWIYIFVFLLSYDLVFTGGKEAILDKFAKLDGKVVFAAEDAIWPDKSLEVSRSLCILLDHSFIIDSKKKWPAIL